MGCIRAGQLCACQGGVQQSRAPVCMSGWGSGTGKYEWQGPDPDCTAARVASCNEHSVIASQATGLVPISTVRIRVETSPQQPLTCQRLDS